MVAATETVRARVISTEVASEVGRTGPIGQVHSGFRSAVNLELGEVLVTIATPSSGALPNGLVLEADYDLSYLPVGAMVWGEGLALRCGDLKIEFGDAELWSPVLRKRGPFRPIAGVQAPLARALARSRARGGFSAKLGQPLHEVANEFPVMRAVREHDLNGAIAGARQLIGLGQGLTPSGDDFLIGFSAALRATDHPLHAPFAAECWRHARGRTTTVAEIFYRYAARGAYSARIHGLVAVLTMPTANLQYALERALDWGASSGADCLLGVLLGGEAAR